MLRVAVEPLDLVIFAVFLVWTVYLARARWAARRDWHKYSRDTRLLYLAIAPALTLAVDLLIVSDRYFWGAPPKTSRARKMSGAGQRPQTGYVQGLPLR